MSETAKKETLEEQLKRRASGEFRLDIKGLEQRHVSVKQGDSVLKSTVYIKPNEVETVAELMDWVDDEEITKVG